MNKLKTIKEDIEEVRTETYRPYKEWYEMGIEEKIERLAKKQEQIINYINSN